LGLLVTVVLLIFPDGRPLSRRWRLVVWSSFAAITTVVVSLAAGFWGLPETVILNGVGQVGRGKRASPCLRSHCTPTS
jgi:hypothetical protein